VGHLTVGTYHFVHRPTSGRVPIEEIADAHPDCLHGSEIQCRPGRQRGGSNLLRKYGGQRIILIAHFGRLELPRWRAAPPSSLAIGREPLDAPKGASGTNIKAGDRSRGLDAPGRCTGTNSGGALGRDALDAPTVASGAPIMPGEPGDAPRGEQWSNRSGATRLLRPTGTDGTVCGGSGKSEYCRMFKEMNFLSAHRSSNPICPRRYVQARSTARLPTGCRRGLHRLCG
jgi:hypothetical protein